MKRVFAVLLFAFAVVAQPKQPFSVVEASIPDMQKALREKRVTSRDLVRARPLAPIAMKGISREVVPYEVEGLLGDLAQRPQVISEHATGLDLFLDLEALDERGAERARKRLSEALLALTVRSKAGAEDRSLHPHPSS